MSRTNKKKKKIRTKTKQKTSPPLPSPPLPSPIRDAIPASSRQHLIIGLNLLRLLAQNRIAEFHTELELIPVEEHNNIYIKYSIQLELFIMEGSYNKLRNARSKVPANEYLVFTDMLMDTIREEVASCGEKAYDQLRLSEAQKLLMIPDQGAFLAYAAKRNWKVLPSGYVRFHQDQDKEAVAKMKEARDVIVDMLTYAKELEKIV